MAKRKLTSLRSVLLRYLLLCGGGCALILVLWWVIFMQLINIGFLLPAVASAQACSEAGWNQEEAVQSIFEENGFKGASTFRDYGNNPRFTAWLKV